MTCAGEYLWYYDQNYYWIAKVNSYGSYMDSFDPGDRSIRDVAWDGENLWTINTLGVLKKFSTSGTPLDTISGLLPGGWGLAFDGTFLWASDPVNDRIYQISLVDDTVPPAAPVIASPTHPQSSQWYSNASPTFTWTPLEDPSGIAGYSFLLDSSPATIPDTTVDSTNATVSFFSLQDGPWYFHCRARDGVGNWGEAGHHRILIDTMPPVQGTVLVAGGADTTTSLLVTLNQLGAVDVSSGLGSGATMVFSSDDLSWSPEEPLVTIRTGWDLSQFGGNNLSGMKRVYVRFKDVAGNWSASFSDHIVYSAPFFITTESLISGTLGFTYADTLEAAGGWPPYEWEIVSGTLPDGLQMHAAGIVWGEPETEGTFAVTVQATDANGATDRQDLSIAIQVETSKGDVNGDAMVNVLDLVLTIRYILGLVPFTPTQFWAADIWTDGIINVMDALRIVNIILSTPMAKTVQTNEQATVWIENTGLPGGSSFAIRLESPVAPSAVQVAIGLAEGAMLAGPPESPHFLVSYKEERGLVKAVLYALSESAELTDSPLTLLTLDFSLAAGPVSIEHITLSDERGMLVPASVKATDTVAPTGWTLVQNYPNPFNPTTAISYQLSAVSSSVHTTLKIYNVLGQELVTLVDEMKEAGQYTVTWDGRDAGGESVPSGVYLCRMEAGGAAQTMKMTLSK